ISLSFSFHVTSPTHIYTLSLHDALPIFHLCENACQPVDTDSGFLQNLDFLFVLDVPDHKFLRPITGTQGLLERHGTLIELLFNRSEEYTSELQSRGHLVCRLLLEKKKRS